MKKFQLNLNQLKVESFETIQPESKTGTINGFYEESVNEPCPSGGGGTCYGTCFEVSCRTCGYTCITCDGRPTCEDTCQGSCLGTCDVQCNF